jgi:hypothetical protein
MSVRINGTTGVTTPNLTATTKVTTADLANTGNYNGGQLGNRNLVINGAMQVAQRGTSSTTSGYHTLDRFLHGRSGGTRTFSQQTLTAGAPFDLGLRNYMRMLNTTPGSTNTTDYAEVYHKIEAQDVATSGWNYKSSTSYITISFWVRSSVAGTYTWWMRDEDATSYTYAFNYTLAANTWTKVTHSIPGHSGLVFNNDNGAGLRIQWMAYYGSNYCSASATLNEWSTGSSLPIHDTTWNTTSGATFDITGVQLEVGDTATPFEHRTHGDVLAACQRYYYQIGGASQGGDGYQYLAHGFADNSSRAIHLVPFPQDMRAAPTFVCSQTAGEFYWRAHIGNPTSPTATAIPTLATSSVRMARVDCNSSGFNTVGAGCFFEQKNSVNTFIAFSAEL